MSFENIKLIIALFFVTLSLTYFYKTENKNETYMLFNARSSFVKIVVENEVLMTNCSDDQVYNENCDISSITSDGYQIFGSGIIINYNSKNFILTAAHVCNQMENGYVVSGDGEVLGIRFSSPFAMTLDGMLQKVEVIRKDLIHDLCLLDFERKDQYNGIEVFDSSLIPGERVYNLAAPKGVFEPGNVLIFEGFYTGKISLAGGSSMFTIYAEQGSSGSGVINNKGQLVSMIHSTLTIIDNVSLGADLNVIREFLENE
jgi:S1-C subfamily serine protease